MWSLFCCLGLKSFMLALIGIKKDQSQRFLENGKRIPVTLIDVKDNTVIALKTADKNKYQAVQLGISIKKNASRAELGHAKGAKLEKAPKFLREVRIIDESEVLPEVGAVLNPSEVFTPGDIVDVLGVSKGKGFQGGMKRHNFSGGPKTHGQSDRWRAPGSIGQGTTPGRVYKGKRMAGRMGNDNVTMENLEVVSVTNDGVLIVKGLVPGIRNGVLMVKKVGENKKFVPLQKTQEELALRDAQDADASAKAEEKEKLEAEAVAAKAQEVLQDTQDADATATAPAEETSVDEAPAAEDSNEEVKAEESEEKSEEPAEEVAEVSEETTDEVKEGESAGAKAMADKEDGNK